MKARVIAAEHDHPDARLGARGIVPRRDHAEVEGAPELKERLRVDPEAVELAEILGEDRRVPGQLALERGEDADVEREALPGLGQRVGDDDRRLGPALQVAARRIEGQDGAGRGLRVGSRVDEVRTITARPAQARDEEQNPPAGPPRTSERAHGRQRT